MDTNRSYMVALLGVLCIAVLVLQTFSGDYAYRLTIGGVILMGCVYNTVDSRGMKVACVLCIIVLVIRGVLQ